MGNRYRNHLLAWLCVLALSFCTGCTTFNRQKLEYPQNHTESIADISTVTTTTTTITTTTVAVKETWDSCPIKVSGFVRGSSIDRNEYFELVVKNSTARDIDSVKLMFKFVNSPSSGSEQVVTGTCTLDTIWADGSLSKVVSASGYCFSRATIYPVCVYFKDGSVWGNSSASIDDIIKKSCAFEVKHVAYSFPDMNDL